jgi:hypothetical protein
MNKSDAAAYHCTFPGKGGKKNFKTALQPSVLFECEEVT